MHNPNHVHYGRLPGFHLSPEGILQAELASKTLRKFNISAVYSSPLERAIETAQIIISKLMLRTDYQISELLNEAYSPLDGYPTSGLRSENGNLVTGNEALFEQPEGILQRAREFMLMVRKKHHREQVVAVTHGDVIAYSVLWCRQLPLTSDQTQILFKTFLTFASISSFSFETELESETPVFEYDLPSL